RDAAEQFAQVVLSLHLEVARLDATEESAEYGLDDVFRIDAAGQMLTDAFAGQVEQAIDVGVEHLSSGVLVAGTQQTQQRLGIVRVGHDFAPIVDDWPRDRMRNRGVARRHPSRRAERSRLAMQSLCLYFTRRLIVCHSGHCFPKGISRTV